VTRIVTSLGLLLIVIYSWDQPLKDLFESLTVETFRNHPNSG
jgi:hypothetical protein